MIDSSTKPKQILAIEDNSPLLNTASDKGMQAPCQKKFKLIERGITDEGVKSIYDQISGFNAVLEAKLHLLHECLTPKGAKEADTTFLTLEKKKLVDYLANRNNNIAKDYIEKLTELRISLLGS